MFELADAVLAWQTDRREVVVARLIDSHGFSSTEPAAAVAATADEPLAGSMFSGAADAQLAELLRDSTSRVEELAVTDAAAHQVGLSCGGRARLLIQPATQIPSETWRLLADRNPCCLISRLADDIGGTDVYTPDTVGTITGRHATEIARLAARGSSRTTVLAEQDLLVTALWPVPALLVIGDGLIADALCSVARLLDWTASTADGEAQATSAAAALRTGDGIVVLSHDLEISGNALRAALEGPASYVGALGSRRTQAARAGWLTAHCVAESAVARIHGPAGLDIGAMTPYEIALAIIAEMLAARTGRTAMSLRDRDGSIHPNGVQAPPPRYPAG
jgi:xanthine dehydrogenase accessory factor